MGNLCQLKTTSGRGDSDETDGIINDVNINISCFNWPMRRRNGKTNTQEQTKVT